MKPNRVVLSLFALLLAGTGCQAASNNGTTIGSRSGEQAARTAGSPTWIRYTDNAEGAFSMEVPVGWQVEGGMYRFGYFDVRWMMDVRSLDGKVVIRINDPNVPPYVLPGPHSGQVGQMASKPGQYQMVVDNFRDARAYAEKYSRHRFGTVCSSLTERDADWKPAMPPAWQFGPGEQKATEASVAFDCATSNGTRIVNTYTRTHIVGRDGLWLVDPIISIVATPDKLSEARAMTQRMIESWQETPEWKTHQDQMTQMGLAQIQRGFRDFMTQMQAYHQQRTAAMNQQVSQFESRQNAQAAQVSTWDNILTGLTNVSDPQTGQQFQVFSGPKANYYVNGQGQTVNSNLSPGPSFRLVQNLGP